MHEGGSTVDDSEDAGQAATEPAASSQRERTKIGRYAILRRLGAGGMGVVFEATDPELGRNVAIKVLHEDRASSPERLRREAQALARLDHPNVVAVHDVGVDDGELYLVMQLVAGTTLDRAWKGRRRRDVIALVLQAGRGLAAAHAAGIVHRDFKPTNVLVSGDTVRVTDFGLSRASDGAPAAPSAALAVSLTDGSLVGTPSYMAPEQLRGGPITPAADQFAFCVTLWEALAGERPYPGRDLAARREAVLAGTRRELPAGIPRRIRAALLRGLATDPAERFPSMEALLAELSPDRRPLWIAGGLLGAGVLGASFALLGARPEVDPCRGADLAADLVWNEGHREALHQRHGAVAPMLIAALDDRAIRWRATRIEACQAPDAGERDARYACLDRSLLDHRAALEALLGPLAPAANTLDIARGGRDPADCTRERAAEASVAPAQAIAPEALQLEVAALLAPAHGGDYRPLMARRGELESRVLASRDLDLISEWHLRVGLGLIASSEGEAARAELRRAAETAAQARQFARAAWAWTELAEAAATLGELEGADNALAAARTAAVHVDQPIVPIRIELAEAAIATERGDFRGAIAKCRHALATARAAGVDVEYAALRCLYLAQIPADPVAAVATARELLQRTTTLRGPDHPQTVEAERDLASALGLAGDRAESNRHFDLALAGVERIYGKDSVDVGRVLQSIAIAESPGATSTPRALAAIERAVAIFDRAGAPLQERASMYETLGFVQGALGRPADAIASYERVVLLYEKLDDPLALARSLYNLADWYRDQKQCDRAVPRFERAIRVLETTGSKTIVAAAARGGIGMCLGASATWTEAETALRQAIADLDLLEAPIEAAQFRFELAKQHARRGRRAAGVELATAAAKQLAGQPPPADQLLAEITAWLAKP